MPFFWISMLPSMSGIELMQNDPRRTDFSKLPVIVFSNTYLTNMIQEAWKAGATKCLSKANLHSTTSHRRRAQFRWDPEWHAPEVTRSHQFCLAESESGRKQPDKHRPRSLSRGSDAEFQAELRNTFLTRICPAILASLCAPRSRLCRKRPRRQETPQGTHLRSLPPIHALTGNAALAGMIHIAQMADALEALLKELHDKPENINASTLRTVASAIDFLGMLFEAQPVHQTRIISPAKVLVVDDEAIPAAPSSTRWKRPSSNRQCVRTRFKRFQPAPGKPIRPDFPRRGHAET